MTICKMHPSHKFLALKNAMNLCYKAQNFITAAHLARSILDLESKVLNYFLNIMSTAPNKITLWCYNIPKFKI
jgi:hypothetical protein